MGFPGPGIMYPKGVEPVRVAHGVDRMCRGLCFTRFVDVVSCFLYIFVRVLKICIESGGVPLVVKRVGVCW